MPIVLQLPGLRRLESLPRPFLVTQLPHIFEYNNACPNLNQPSTDVDYDHECFEESKRLFAAFDNSWIFRATLALA